jgi:hypothetical protein
MTDMVKGPTLDQEEAMTETAPIDGPEAVIACATGGAWRREALEAVASLGLPDCWIGAGFVRAPVWDALHGFPEPTPLDDIDVVYFDPACRDPEAERAHEAALARKFPGQPWSVRNQARMHARNGDAPYGSTADALTHWLAPLGLDDLLGLVIRPTPYARARRIAAFRERLATKGWLETWPKLRVVMDDLPRLRPSTEGPPKRGHSPSIE